MHTPNYSGGHSFPPCMQAPTPTIAYYFISKQTLLFYGMGNALLFYGPPYNNLILEAGQ